MRRIAAVLAALVLLVALSTVTIAAGPIARVNRFVGDFDMLDHDTGQYVAHVVVNFTQPTDAKLVPGTLDIYWAPDLSSDEFLFMDLGAPVKESHAQLFTAYFGVEPGYATVAAAEGYLCDYAGLANAGCRTFGVHFDDVFAEGQPNAAWWVVPVGWDNPQVWFVVGKGGFALTYAGPTEG